ncbi:MAG TPA: hypothetical protein PK668_05035 [Myxococcota bacterium]|nr:hypothetical protein [Myxococcota bacterium]HRY92222.1 hypothetical protein [Myxococcota bacterium]
MKHKTEYLASGGVFCPHCHADDIEGGPVEISAGEATQEVTCLKCEAVWQDVYTLTDVESVEPPENT